MRSHSRSRPLITLTLALVVAPIGAIRAQVGHDPASSPYRDLRFSQFLTGTVGWVGGSGGTLGIGPHRGWVTTLRHDFMADRTLTLGLQGSYAQLERNYVDFGASASARLKGPVDHNVIMAGAYVQFNVTGGKTWHGLAPFAIGGLGLAFDENIVADSSSYNFGTKFYFTPSIGTRVFLSRRFYMRLEAQSIFWSLSYPDRFRTDDPDGVGPLTPVLPSTRKEWSIVPMLHAGFGFSFRRPFF